MTQEEFIITIYLKIEEMLSGMKKIRAGGFKPALTDGEALTIVIVGEFIGIHTDKQIWAYFKEHYAQWFPKLKDRTIFTRQCSNLLIVKQKMLEILFRETKKDNIHMQDGVPLPVMVYTRSKRDKCFKGEADYGYCASKDMKYYGFLGHVQIDFKGNISGFMLTSPKADERDALRDMTNEIQGMILADKGYIGAELKQELAEQQINLQTPFKKNMKDGRDKQFIRQIVSKRRLIETVIGQLTERLSINVIKVKDFWHYQGRVARKLLAHCLGTRIAQSLGSDATALYNIISV